MGSHDIDKRGRRRASSLASPLLAALLVATVAGACAGSPDDGDDLPEPDTEVGAPVLASAGPVSVSEPVGPSADSPFAGVRRDCGIATPLADGSTLWFYCDTLRFAADGELEFFLNTSVARATEDEPLVMIDQPDRRGDLRPVLDPVPGYPPCTAGQGSFTWPTAAITEPLDDRRDRVVVFFENVCVLPGVLEGHDVGVAEVVYDHGQPPDPNHPIVAEVIEPRLFPRVDGEPPFGLAAVAHDGWVYVYRCPASTAACEVARVRPGDVASTDAYRYWTGGGWSAEADEAVGMDMPDGLEGTKPAVERVDDLGVFVMANHPIAATGTVALRVASSPTGPWSAPAVVELPGCAGFYPEICFAAEVNDHLSGPDTIGLTWFDPTVPPGPDSPTRFAQVPVSIDASSRD